MRRAGYLAAALCCAWPAVAGPPTVPRYIVSVRNATSTPLTCRMQIDGNAAETALLAAGQEWQRRVTRTTAVASMSCAAPVRAVLFKLLPGRRYVLLRGGIGKGDFMRGSKEGSVDLRDVTATS